MPITNTQEVYKVRSISRVCINPSIMEGTQQLTSILGPDRGKLIVRYAPNFTTSALLTGQAGIPSWLECSPGVVNASPQAFRSYQWYADNVIIPGAITNRFQTSNSYDSKVLKCIVRAFNILGEAFSESNTITATVIEPIFVREADYYPITGLGTNNVETVLNLSLIPLTGMSVGNNVTNFGVAIYPITGMGSFNALSANQFDTYLMGFYTLMRTLPVSNNDAESASTAGWTIESGSFASLAGPAKSGARFFRSSTINVLSRITRVIPIVEVGDLAQIAAKNVAARVGYWATNDYTNSYNAGEMRVYLEALDAGGVTVATLNQFGWVTPPQKTENNLWYAYDYVAEVLPVTTTQLRIIIEFASENVTNGNCCNLDEISLQLFKV